MSEKGKTSPTSEQTDDNANLPIGNINIIDEQKLQTKESPHPIDHGWAWMVMFCAFLNISIFMSYGRSSSLLFIIFLDKYRESAAMTTMIFMCGSAMFSVCNIIGPVFLYHRLEVRTLAVSGAIGNCVSIFVIAFAPNIYVIDVMSACMGFSQGLIVVPQMILIGHYFKKRLAFATAFVSLGLSVATIVGPPLTQFLLDKYALQGAIMLLAGINMNCIPASMLFRPVLQNKKLNKSQESNKLIHESCDKNVDEENAKEISRNEPNGSRDMFKHNENDGIKIEENISLMRNVSIDNQARTKQLSESEEKDVRSMSHMNGSPIFTNFNIETDKISRSSSVMYLSEVNLFIVDSVLQDESSVVNTKHIQRASIDKTTDEISIEYISQSNDQTCFTRIRKSISQSIYTQPLAILLLLASAFGVHPQACVSYMPATGKENGLTNDEVPYLVTVFGITDLIFKLLIGFIADLGFFKRIHIVIACQVVAGTLLQFVAFFKGIELMMVLQIGLGMTLSIMHTLVAVIIVDVMGLQYMGRIMAAYYLLNGIVLSTDHIVVGALKDFTGSFVAGYNYIGSLILLSGAILLLINFLSKCKPFKS